MQLSVTTHPNSNNPRIETDLSGTLHIYVQAPPFEGKANQATLEALANHFKKKNNQIIQVKGLKSKIKVFEIN